MSIARFVLLGFAAGCTLPSPPYGACRFSPEGSTGCRAGASCWPDGVCRAEACEPGSTIGCPAPGTSLADGGRHLCSERREWSACEAWPCVFGGASTCPEGLACHPEGLCRRPCDPGDAPIACQAPGSRLPGTGRHVCGDAGWTSCLGEPCDFPGSGACPAGQFCLPDGGCRDDGCAGPVSCVVDAGVPGLHACARSGELERRCERLSCSTATDCGRGLDCVSGGCDLCQETSPCVADGGFVGVKRCDGGAPVCEAVSCPKQLGVCKGAKLRVNDDGGCTGTSYGSEYRLIDDCVGADGGYGETDNNCDGFTASGEVVTLARSANEVAAVGTPTGSPYVVAIAFVDGGQLTLEAWEFNNQLMPPRTKVSLHSRSADAGVFSPAISASANNVSIVYRAGSRSIVRCTVQGRTYLCDDPYITSDSILLGPRVATATSTNAVSFVTASSRAVLQFRNNSQNPTLGASPVLQDVLGVSAPGVLPVLWGNGSPDVHVAVLDLNRTGVLYSPLKEDGGTDGRFFGALSVIRETLAVAGAEHVTGAACYVDSVPAVSLADLRRSNMGSAASFSGTNPPSGQTLTSLALALSVLDGGVQPDGGPRASAAGLVAARVGDVVAVTPLANGGTTEVMLTDVVGPVAAAWSSTNARYALIAAPVRVDGGTTDIVGRLVCMPPPVSW